MSREQEQVIWQLLGSTDAERIDGAIPLSSGDETHGLAVTAR